MPGTDVREVGELRERHQRAEQEHLDHAPRPHRCTSRNIAAKSARHAPEPERQQHVQHRADLERRHQESSSRTRAPPRSSSRRRGASGPCGAAWSTCGCPAHRGRRSGSCSPPRQTTAAASVRERAIEPVGVVAVEHRAAAPAECLAARRERHRLPLEKIALVAGDQPRPGHRSHPGRGAAALISRAAAAGPSPGRRRPASRRRARPAGWRAGSSRCSRSPCSSPRRCRRRQ